MFYRKKLPGQYGIRNIVKRNKAPTIHDDVKWSSVVGLRSRKNFKTRAIPTVPMVQLEIYLLAFASISDPDLVNESTWIVYNDSES